MFATFSEKTPPFADYIGAELVGCIDRVFIGPLKVLGYHSQVLPNNWKLYAENNKDSYHASLLHVFHKHVRRGAPDNGWRRSDQRKRLASSQLYRARAVDDDEIGKEKVRSLDEEYRLEDASLMEHRLELGDTVTNSIQTVFPTLVIQQILNALAVRQLVPRRPRIAQS